MNQPLPSVSVVIAAYNVSNFIAQSVEAALAQQGVQVEVILVDDCSTDNTWQELSAFTDPRIRIFRLAQNGGPGAARNRGFAEARGEWLAVLDADDSMAPTRLADCIAAANAINADIAVDNLTVERLDDGTSYPMFPPAAFTRSTLALPTFISGKFSSCGKRHSLGYLKPVFRTAFLREHALRYKPELRIGEDFILLAEALACGGACAIAPGAGYRYRVRSGSISHRLTPASITAMLTADATFISVYPLSPDAMRAMKRRGAFLREYLRTHELVDALKAGSVIRAATILLRDPLCARHLWEAVRKRIAAQASTNRS